VSDPDGDTMDVRFYNASNDQLIGTAYNIPNGGKASIVWSDLSFYTEYRWYVVADDGNGGTTRSSTWSFTTRPGRIWVELQNNNPVSGETIDYTTVTFNWTATPVSPPDLNYSYCLEGYEPIKSPWSNRTSKTYFDLPDGNYVFKVWAKTPDGRISDPTVCSFSIIEGYTYNEAADGDEAGASYQCTYSFGRNIAGTMRIDMVGPDSKKRIYIFDLGLIEYKLSSVSGTSKIVLENNGILSVTGNTGYVKRGPVFSVSNNLITFRVMQIRNLGMYRGFSGNTLMGIYLQENYVREMLTNVTYFKVKIYGRYSDIWLDYFKDVYSFEEDPWDPTGHTLYYPIDGSFKMLVTQSMCKVSLAANR